MSQKALELLRVTGLFKDGITPADLSGRSSADLEKILLYYYEKRVELLRGEIEKLSAEKLAGSALLSSFSTRRGMDGLCSKLVVERSLVVDDPLFGFAAPRSEATKPWQIRQDQELDAAALLRHLKYFSTAAPLIKEGLLHVLPLSVLHRPPAEIPFNLPADRYRELVPPSVRSFIDESVIIRPMRRTSDKVEIFNRANTERSPMIAITFKNDSSPHFAWYQYSQPKFTLVDDQRLEFEFPLYDDSPVDPVMYGAWVEQSINSTVGRRLQSIAKEMALSDALNITYLTESAFEAELLARSGEPTEVTPKPAINFLDANRSLLNLTDVESLIKLRNRDARLLDRFRLTLAEIAEELKGLKDDAFDQKANQLFERDVKPQIDEVNDSILKIEASAKKGVLQTFGAICLGTLTGSALPAAAIFVLMANGTYSEAVPAIKDYMTLRKRPQFIWQQMSKK